MTPTNTPRDVTHMTDDTIRALMESVTEGPYDCHLGSDGVCQCASIVGMHGGMGALAIVCVDNGLPISEGGNDAPDLEQAKANARLLTAAPDLAAECLARGAERDAALARVKELDAQIIPTVTLQRWAASVFHWCDGGSNAWEEISAIIAAGKGKP